MENLLEQASQNNSKIIVFSLNDNFTETLINTLSMDIMNQKLYDKSILEQKNPIKYIKKLLYIDTKYYSANTEILICDYQEISEDQVKFEQQLKSIKNIEAIIFTLQTDEQNTIPKQASDYFNKVCRIVMNIISPSTSLLFVNCQEDFNEEKRLEAIYDQADEYYIEIVHDNLETYEIQHQKKLSMLRQKIGFERIKGALQCNMWSNMKRKKVVKRTLEIKQEYKEQFEQENQKKQISEEIKQSQPNDINKKQEQQQKQKEQKKQSEPQNSQAKSMMPQFDEDDMANLEMEMESFGAMLDEMKHFKEKSKHLSDKDRKTQAEDLILKLVANFKDIDGDEGEEGELDPIHFK